MIFTANAELMESHLKFTEIDTSYIASKYKYTVDVLDVHVVHFC